MRLLTLAYNTFYFLPFRCVTGTWNAILNNNFQEHVGIGGHFFLRDAGRTTVHRFLRRPSRRKPSLSFIYMGVWCRMRHFRQRRAFLRHNLPPLRNANGVGRFVGQAA